METKEKEISYFKSCRSRKGLTVNVNAALHWIKTGSSKELVKRIRNANTESEKDALKQSLPAVTFGGLFKDRTSLLAPSGYACLDFDKVKDLEGLKAALKASKYIYAFWLSPSGKGIKALVPIPDVENKKEYRSYYKGILKHFEHLQPDISTKDINRLCFESYDPELYLNDTAEIFQKKIIPESKVSNQQAVNSHLGEDKVVDRIISWWVKKFSFSKGNRNNSLFILACALSNFGVSKSTTEDLFYSFEEEDFHYGEIVQIINSAYKKADFNSQTFSK